jgi:hypothetical protein
MRRHSAVALAFALCAWGLAIGVPSALAGSTFTWSGAEPESLDWSLGGNWLGGSAPSAGDSGDSLVFPADLTGGDCLTTVNDVCYLSADDLPGYDIDGLTIDDGVGYNIAGADTLTIGSSGITATTAASAFNPSEIDTPIALSAPQTWGIDGGPSDEGELIDGGGVTGTGNALDVRLSQAGYLDLDLGSNNEVGNVKITGLISGDTGLSAYDNGALELADGSDLNGSDANPIQLTHAGIFGDGLIGPITSTGGVITAGDPLGILNVSGAVTLDSASELQFGIAEAGSTAGTDYSQLSATGNINLGGADLDITGTDKNNDCPTLATSTVDTLVTTTGTISGTFGNVANGGVYGLVCTSASPVDVTITYTAHSITAELVPPIPIYTDTSLAYAPDTQLPYAGASVTLTATVSAAKGIPQGSVAFTSDGTAIPGCAAQPLQLVGATWEAVCATTYGAAGSFPAFQVAFQPSTGSADEISSSGVVYANVAVRADNPDLGALKAGAATVAGDAASVPVTCSVPSYYGAPICDGTAEIAVSRTVTVTVHGKRRRVQGIRSVGSATFTVNQSSTTEQVALDADGRRLLDTKHSLRVTLIVKNSGAGNGTISTQHLTFKHPR